jgi:L-threonylcarbamoyladenylate synthase
MARADSQKVLEKLYRVKDRPVTSPTALFVRSRDEIGRLGRTNRVSDRLAEAFLPGPLTLVLESKHDWPPPRTVDGKIGVRCSSAALIDAVLAVVDYPTTATSANRSGRPDHERVQDIKEVFRDEVDLYLDAGPLSGAPSTVVDCSQDNVTVLREGVISAARIEQVIGELDEPEG